MSNAENELRNIATGTSGWLITKEARELLGKTIACCERQSDTIAELKKKSEDLPNFQARLRCEQQLLAEAYAENIVLQSRVDAYVRAVEVFNEQMMPRPA